jgi:hypothetical protein
MKERTLLSAAVIALFVAMPVSAVKYVAVVEMEIDMKPSEAAKLEKSEVRLITDELREKAVNNLPRSQYSVMTTETVIAQSGAVLSECAEENCVITLGSRIGADYIVRGKLGKFQTLFTLSVVIYDTEDGFLVASSRAVRSERLTELLEKASVACEEMYQKFVNSESHTLQGSIAQRPTQQNLAPKSQITYTVTVNPTNGGMVSHSPNKAAYAAGERITITATPFDGYEFTGWLGAVTGAVNPGIITVNGNMIIAADFQYIKHTYASTINTSQSPQGDGLVTSDSKQIYTLTTEVFPSGFGSVIRDPNKDAYKNGEKVTLLATAYAGCMFAGWIGETENNENRQIVVTMDGDKTLTAKFHGQREVEPPTEGYYIGVSLPLLGSPVLNGEWVSIEGGWFGDNKLAYGFEFGGGFMGDAHNQTNLLTGIGYRETIGGGFNISRIMGKRWVLGMSTGYWYGRFELEDYPTPLQTVHVFGGPFIKLRFLKVCEITYRGFIGYMQDGSYDSSNSTFISGSKKEFTWASQFKFGLHFEITGGSTQRRQ